MVCWWDRVRTAAGAILICNSAQRCCPICMSHCCRGGACRQPNSNHSTTTSSLPCSLLAAQVRVQAGARVQAVADELRGHGLTLQNYASIREQTVGGFIQVSSVLADQLAGGCIEWPADWLP